MRLTHGMLHKKQTVTVPLLRVSCATRCEFLTFWGWTLAPHGGKAMALSLPHLKLQFYTYTYNGQIYHNNNGNIILILISTFYICTLMIIIEIAKPNQQWQNQSSFLIQPIWYPWSQITKNCEHLCGNIST